VGPEESLKMEVERLKRQFEAIGEEIKEQIIAGNAKMWRMRRTYSCKGRIL